MGSNETWFLSTDQIIQVKLNMKLINLSQFNKSIEFEMIIGQLKKKRVKINLVTRHI